MMIFSVYLSLILWFHVFISQYKSRCSLLLAVKILVDSYKPRCRLHIPSLSDSLVFGTSSIFKAVKSLIEQQSCIYTASAENQCVPHAAYWQQLDPGLKSNQTPVWLQYLPIELCISATKNLQATVHSADPCYCMLFLIFHLRHFPRDGANGISQINMKVKFLD